jgi:hypothetical protein
MRGIARAQTTGATTDAEAGWYVVFQEQPTEPRFGPRATSSSGTIHADALAAALIRPAFRMLFHASDLLPQ